jgi:transcriptional regulator with XRE-family HTH domain
VAQLDHTNVRAIIQFANNFYNNLYFFVVARPVSRKKIRKFKQDVDFLVSRGISQEDIAKKMGMAATNFSDYYNENIGITNQFLGKFYDAWDTDLEPDNDENLVRGVDEIYRIHDTIVEKLVDGQNRLINKNSDLQEYNQKLMDLIIRLGISPEPRPGQQEAGGQNKSPGE